MLFNQSSLDRAMPDALTTVPLSLLLLPLVRK